MALALRHERDDGALLDQLARLIEKLRLVRYQSILVKVQELPTPAVEEFSDLFSRHLLYEEDILFPVLREPDPGLAEPALRGLREEHDRLRFFVRELVIRVRAGDPEGACDAARVFMAALLDHIGRESRATRKLLRKLDPLSAARLRRLTESERPLE
jgi:iron-sulfur cluster repair protein YtfE (RIC family)